MNTGVIELSNLRVFTVKFVPNLDLVRTTNDFMSCHGDGKAPQQFDDLSFFPFPA
jgi:hypothetical protein